MPKFTITYAFTPTGFNGNRVMHTDTLAGVFTKGAIKGIDFALPMIRPTVVFKVTEELEDQIAVHYEYRGYSEPYMSDHIKEMIVVQKKEVYV